MTVYTSNYARNGTHPNAIAISRKPPDWYTGTALPELAPTWEMIMAHKEGNITEMDFISMYVDLLHRQRFDPNKFIEPLPDPTFLLCYEKPGDFCHRRVLAEWIELKTGIAIPEWKNEKEEAAAKQDEMVDSLLDF